MSYPLSALVTDEDECSAANLGRFCPAPGDCTNTDGSYTCECPEGYKITATGCKGS